LNLGLAVIMVSAFLPGGEALGADTRLAVGNYYFSVPANGGQNPDNGAIGLISATEGVLMDGSESTYAGWMGTGPGTPETVKVVVDLLKDYPLNRIRVVLNSPNQYWGFREFTLKYRSESMPDYYYLAANYLRDVNDKNPNFSITVPMENKMARFIVIEIRRYHEYQHIPLTEVEIFKGVGEEGQNPGTALTVEQMQAELMKPALREGVLRTGNYYFSVPANGGQNPDNGAVGLISATEGVLMDGSESTYAGWMGTGPGTPGTVQVVVDLLKDYPLDRIRLVLNSPNQYWGFKELTVKYRSEATSDYYYIATKQVREGNDLNYSITVPMENKTARFIVIDIKRSHAYQHIPLAEIEIYRGTGEDGQNPVPAFNEEQLRAEMKKDAVMVDKYGQWLYEDWPGKVTSDGQLRQEYTEEANRLSEVEPDQNIYDQYGGIKSGGQYEATGFFRLQEIDGKWWFITPDGYKFILKGVDAASIWEWGYGTPIKKADGTPRQVFEELPDPVEFAPAYVNDADGERISFVIANVMRKYGEDYEAKWEDITKKRLIDWGFNAFSKWTRPGNVTFPYIHVLQDPANLRRIQWTYDVFDPQNETIIENALRTTLKSNAEDSWLIGYIYDNEAGWTADIVKEVLTYDSTSPAKNAFVDFLSQRYNYNLDIVNELLETDAESFDELKDKPIDIAMVPTTDVSEYIRLASRTYFSTITKVIRKYDQNHLFLGSSIVPTWRTSLDWDSAAMEYVDAFSVDNYTNDAGWISRYEEFGKPLLNLEFSFGTSERGLSPVNATTKVASMAERGNAYQAFVENQVVHPLFVGFGWFAYYDQAVPGRKDGENFNIGLVNQQDQPYTDMVNIVKKVNAGLERLHEQASPPTASDPGSIRIEAENFSASSGGIKVESSSDIGGGQNIADLHPNEWVAYSGIDFTGIDSLGFRVASVRDGTVRVRLDSPEGPIIGTLEIKDTGGWQNWITKNITITPADGVHDLYLTFERQWDNQPIGNINYFVLPAVYEAEEAELDGPAFSSHYADYSGTGYAEFSNPNDDYIEWTVNAADTGMYKLIFRYANGSSGDRPLKISVNGNEATESLSFPPTGSWGIWSTTSTIVSLQAGDNTIRVTAIGAGGANLDYLTMKFAADYPPVDTEKPIWPDGAQLTVMDATYRSVHISWENNPAVDNVGVAGYRIDVDGTFNADVPGSVYQYTVTGLNPNTPYTFTVKAYDEAGNESDPLISSTTTRRETDPAPDKSLLESALSEARSLLEGAETGMLSGQYPQESVDQFADAISSAQAVWEDEGANQSEVDAAVAALRQAINQFKSSIIVGPDTPTWVNGRAFASNIGETEVTLS